MLSSVQPSLCALVVLFREHLHLHAVRRAALFHVTLRRRQRPSVLWSRNHPQDQYNNAYVIHTECFMCTCISALVVDTTAPWGTTFLSSEGTAINARRVLSGLRGETS